MCRTIHGLDEVQVEIVNNFICRAQSGELSGCHLCGLQVQTLFLIPCGHLICTECINHKSTECPVCLNQFDADDFQRLQPGLELKYLLTLKEEKEKRQQQQTLARETSVAERSERVVVMNELREADAGADLPVQIISNARRHRKGESCMYSSSAKDGKCTVCREEHYDCNFMNTQQQCSVCFKMAEECPEYASKARYVIDKLLQLRENDANGALNNVSPMVIRVYGKQRMTTRRLKVIVFSEFRESYVRHPLASLLPMHLCSFTHPLCHT